MLVSIDPGKSGAYAVWSNEGQLLETYKVKVPLGQRLFSHGQLEILSDIIDDARIEQGHLNYNLVRVVTEGILEHKMKYQSPVATNTTAINHGMQIATCLLAGATSVDSVPPRTWKKALGLSKDKDASVVLARKLVDPTFLRKPRMRVDNADIAEAILIGIYYGRKELNWNV